MDPDSSSAAPCDSPLASVRVAPPRRAVPLQIAAPTWIALAVLAIAWFLMATLVSTFGPVQQVAHFYDLGTVLRDPSWLVHGAGSAHALEAFAFGTLSAVVLLAPLAAHRFGTRLSWLLYALPLALMVLCGIILYAKTSQPYVRASSDAGAVGALLARVANNVLGQAADTIARHISVGAGGYLAFAAAAFLAYRGVKGFHGRGQPPPT